KNDKTIIHIDSTAAEIDGHYLPAIEVVGEIGESLRALEAGCDFHVPQWIDNRYRHDALHVLERHRSDASFPFKPQRVVADLGTAFVTVIWTDNRYGIIALNQERRFGHTFGAAFTNPDFVKYAEAFGLPGFRVERPDDLLPTLKRALDLAVPSLVEVPIDPAAHRELGCMQGEAVAAPDQLRAPHPRPSYAA